MKEPNYYAVIPASVRYDPKLPPNAKLLYGEITALCNKEGFCWASNQYFADLYNVANKTISDWVKKLKDQGHIDYKVKDYNTRHIFLTGVSGNPDGGVRKNRRGVSGNPDHNNTSNNTSNNTTTSEETSQVVNLIPEVIKLFEPVDPKNKNYYGNKTQRQAVEFLLKEYGFQEIKKRVDVLSHTNQMPYFPNITTPCQLRDKWVILDSQIKRKKNEATIKNNVAF